MDNPKTLTTLGTQDTGQRQTKKYTQHRKPTWTSTVNRGYPGHREGKVVPASSYKTPTVSQIVK